MDTQATLLPPPRGPYVAGTTLGLLHVDGSAFSERLLVPLRWWVQGTMLIVSIFFAVIVAMNEHTVWIAWVVTGLATALMTAGFLNYGRARIAVEGEELHAGRAHIPLTLLGEARALDAQETRRVAGRDADARAYLLLRPYLKESVQVWIDDPADPTPYWLLSTRRPQELARALDQVAERPRP